MSKQEPLAVGLIRHGAHMQTTLSKFTYVSSYLFRLSTDESNMYQNWLLTMKDSPIKEDVLQNWSRHSIMDLPSIVAYECGDLQEHPSLPALARLRMTVNNAIRYFAANIGDAMGLDMSVIQPKIAPAVYGDPWSIYPGPVQLGYNAPSTLTQIWEPVASWHNSTPNPGELLWKHVQAYPVDTTPAIFIRELLAAHGSYEKLSGSASDPEVLTKPLALAAEQLMHRCQGFAGIHIVKKVMDNPTLDMDVVGIYYNKDHAKPTYYVMNGPRVNGKPTTFVVAIYLETLLTALTVMDFITGRTRQDSGIAYEPVIKYLHEKYGHSASDLIDQSDLGDQLPS